MLPTKGTRPNSAMPVNEGTTLPPRPFGYVRACRSGFRALGSRLGRLCCCVCARFVRVWLRFVFCWGLVLISRVSALDLLLLCLLCVGLVLFCFLLGSRIKKYGCSELAGAVNFPLPLEGGLCVCVCVCHPLYQRVVTCN